MPQSAQQVHDEWLSDPERPVMVIDEVRFPTEKTGVPGERLLVAVACVRAKQVLSIINAVDDYRLTLPAAQSRNKLKARRIFGKGSHRPLKALIGRALAEAEYVLRYATSSRHLADLHSGSTIPPARIDDGTVLNGHEVRMLLLILKLAANTWKPGLNRIDAIVDRSDQLGLSLVMRGNEGKGIGFEAFEAGPGVLNRLNSGAQAQTVTDASFRILAVGEETPQYGDALLLADAAAYLTFRQMGPELSDPRLDTGVVPVAPVEGRGFFVVPPALSREQEPRP